jgi:CO/xanthine dehydrogenase Mo-binding subunit
MSEFSVIGTRASNIEAAEKSRGGGRYVSDQILPGMLWAKILHSHFPQG